MAAWYGKRSYEGEFMGGESDADCNLHEEVVSQHRSLKVVQSLQRLQKLYRQRRR